MTRPECSEEGTCERSANDNSALPIGVKAISKTCTSARPVIFLISAISDCCSPSWSLHQAVGSFRLRALPPQFPAILYISASPAPNFLRICEIKNVEKTAGHPWYRSWPSVLKLGYDGQAMIERPARCGAGYVRLVSVSR